MKNIFNFKKYDSISIVLLFFTLFIIILFVYIIQINRHIKSFSSYNNSVNQLKNINKDFDNLLLQKGNFINYDIINQRILDFEENLKFLTSDDASHKTIPKYKILLDNVTKYYKLKLDYIEYFKSENAQFLYSVHYLYSLNKSISESTTIDKQSIYQANEILLHIVKYFMHINIDSEKIMTDLTSLKLNNKENKLIEIYLSHVNINLKRIKRFNEINHLQELQSIDIALNELHLFLHTNYQKNIFIEKVIITVLFIVALIILLLLLLMNRRATRMKEELLGFRTAIENSYNSIIITNLDNNITYVNERAEIESGYSQKELIGQNPRILKSGLNDEKFYAGLHTALEAGEKWEGEFINKTKNGSMLYEKASIMPIYQNNKIVNYLAIKLNITDYIDEKHKVEYMAYHDALTGLPNRLSVEQYLKKRLPLAKQNNTKIAILFIDLDRFKTINDTLGHSVGDELLVECSKRIQHSLRESDILARVGGDEFIIVIEQLDNDYTAAHVSEKIIDLFSTPIQTKSHLLNITLSIGIAIYPDDDDDHLNCQGLFKYADIAMYEAKSEGRNTYRYYQKELSLDAHNRLNLEQNLKESLHNNELFMMYQPQYNLVNKTVTGIEALVRWDSNKLGKISPDIFIPIAEETGFIVDIGLYIFKQACKDFLEFQKYSNTLQDISINISAVQLYQDSFIKNIINITKNIGINPKYIKLEITETHIMKNIIQSKTLLKDLKILGFTISIDDFGTGHSSLKYLKEFPINELKIDKAFIDDLPFNKNNVAITKSIIALSQSMGYTNVAEGIENEEQEAFLKDNLCLTGQGYYFSKPQTKDNLIQFLQNKY